MTRARIFSQSGIGGAGANANITLSLAALEPFLTTANVRETSNLYFSNLRVFSIKADENYFNIKGTPPAIKYLICALLGFGITEVYVTTTTYSNIQISVTSSKYDTLQNYKTFLEQHVIPAGIVIDYKVI
jgi:hypothetical protein